MPRQSVDHELVLWKYQTVETHKGNAERVRKRVPCEILRIKLSLNGVAEAVDARTNYTNVTFETLDLGD